MPQPLYKASVTKAIWHHVELLPPAEHDAVVAALEPGVLDEIMAVGRTAWIPAALQVAVDEAVFQVLGADAQVALMRRYSLAATETPVFAPIARGALALFGSGPLSVLRTLPRTWPFVSKHCGELAVDGEDNSATLSYTNLAPVLRTVSFATATRGSLLGVLEFAKAPDPTVETDLSELEAGTVRQRLSWRVS